MDAMRCAKAMGLDETHDPPGADDGSKPIAHRARSNVRGLFCAILCAVACGCGGGGGSSSGNPNYFDLRALMFYFRFHA